MTEPNTDYVCLGSGHKWGSGTGSPICPVCKRGPGSLGVKRPVRRKGHWTGTVPNHLPRWAWEGTTLPLRTQIDSSEAHHG